MRPSPMLTMQQLEQAAPLIRIAAHPIRLRMLDLLRERESSVGEIAEGAECGQAIASGHLAVLRQHGILAPRREGQKVFYRLLRPELLALLDCIREHCRLAERSS